MGTATHYLEVNVPAEQAYSWWRGLTNLPSIMPDVEKVEALGGDAQRTHWTVKGPLGTTVEWDAHIVEDVTAERIAWATDDSGDTQVKNSGVVRFDDHGETTGVEVSLDYDPPAGILGEAVAHLFADPQKKVEAALAAFKTTIESAAGATGAEQTDKQNDSAR